MLGISLVTRKHSSRLSSYSEKPIFTNNKKTHTNGDHEQIIAQNLLSKSLNSLQMCNTLPTTYIIAMQSVQKEISFL